MGVSEHVVIAMADRNPGFFGTENSAGGRRESRAGARAVRVAPPCEQPAR